jgi:outer membrane lipoprotein-sorting protein
MMTGMGRLSAALLATLVLAGKANAGSLEDLMAVLAAVEERRACFVEERTLGILDELMVTEGTFFYKAPDRLMRQDLLPDAALYALEGDRLDILIDGEEHTLSLDQEPMIQALIAPFRAVFAGDLETLRGSFDVSYADSAGGWALTLKPRAGTSAAQLMTAMTIRGADGRIQRLETKERSGDQSVMRLEPMAPTDDGSGCL